MQSSLSLVIALSVGYVLAGWVGPSGSPSDKDNNNASEPLNVSNKPQTKIGPLIVSNVFTASQIFAGKLGIGSGPVNDPDPNAVLDVDGQIRIRGGNPNRGYVLKTVNGELGLASWEPAGTIQKIYEGVGIDVAGRADQLSSWDDSGYTVIPGASGDGQIAIKSSETQRRLSPDNCASPGAITKVSEAGTTTCQSFVTTVKTGSGLTGAAAPSSGPIDLSLNAGAGLKIDPIDNQLKIKLPATNVGGLQVDAKGDLRLIDCNSSMPFLFWNSALDGGAGGWECGDTAQTPNTDPGESIMYLKMKSGANQPIACISMSSLWTTDSGVYAENAGGGNLNNVRACAYTGKSCQVIYLRSTSSATLASCPFGWNAAYQGNGTACGTTCSTEWAPGGVYTNYTRICSKCY